MDEREHQCRCADCEPRIVIAREVKRFFICADDVEQRRAEKKHDKAHQNASQNRAPKAERAYAPRGSCIVFAEQTRNERAAALPENVAECHQRCEKRRAQRNARNNVRVLRLRHKEGIRKIVDQRDGHAEHQRQG